MWCAAANAKTQSKITAFIISFAYGTEDIYAKCFFQDYDLRIRYPSMTARQSLVEWSQRHNSPVDVVIQP